MTPKWSIRLLRSWCAKLLSIVLVLAGATDIARADGSAVPVLESKAPRVFLGVPANASIAVSGGSAPYRFELVAGALPAGLSLASEGRIVGAATESGTFTYTVRVTDSGSLATSVVQTYLMVVQDRADPASDPSTLALLNQQAGTARRFALTQIDNVQNRLEALRSGSAGRCLDDPRRPSLAQPARTAQRPLGLMEQAPAQDDSLSMPLKNCRTLADRTTTLWTAGSLNVGSNRNQAGADAFRFDSQGVTLGGDFGLHPNLAFGVGVGVARDESQSLSAGGAGNGAYGAALTGYVSYRPADRFYVESVFGVGDLAYDSTRIAATGAEAYGTRRADQRFISVSAGRRFATAGWELMPYTRIDHVRATLRSLTESGGSDALNLAAEKVPGLKLVAGASAATSWPTPIGTLLPRTSLEYRRELERSDAALARYADDPNGQYSSVLPAAADRDSTKLGLGANLYLVNRWNLGLTGTLNRSSAISSTRIDATIGKVF